MRAFSAIYKDARTGGFLVYRSLGSAQVVGAPSRVLPPTSTLAESEFIPSISSLSLPVFGCRKAREMMLHKRRTPTAISISVVAWHASKGCYSPLKLHGPPGARDVATPFVHLHVGGERRLTFTSTGMSVNSASRRILSTPVSGFPESEQPQGSGRTTSSSQISKWNKLLGHYTDVEILFILADTPNPKAK